MNIRDLQYFLAVAELEHFGQAALRCNISQPTLSGQIKKLEETLGFKLFERTNRRVMLTEQGQVILKHARNILNEVETIQEISQSSNDPFSGKFRIGAFPTLATYIFPKMVKEIKTEMPKLKLVLMEDKTHELIESLKKGQIDAALLALPIHEDSLTHKELFKDTFYLAVSPHHELANKKEISQSDLKNHSVLLLDEGHCLRDQSMEICHLHNINEEQDFKATGLETLRQVIKADCGITFMPEIAIIKNEEGIRYIPFKAPAPNRKIALVWRKSTTKEAVIHKMLEILTP